MAANEPITSAVVGVAVQSAGRLPDWACVCEQLFHRIVFPVVPGSHYRLL